MRIKRGQVITTDHILLVPDSEITDTSFVGRYVFEWDVNSVVMVLGYISLVNHDNKPNAKIHLNCKKLTAKLIATKAIEAGQEILINYGSDYPYSL